MTAAGQISSVYTTKLYLFQVRETILVQNSLCDHSTESKHSQTAVRNFLQFHVINLRRGLVLEETSIEPKVTSRTSRSLKRLDQGGSAKDFHKAGPQQNLVHGPGLDQRIVRGDRGEALEKVGCGVHSQAEVYSGKSNNRQHGDAAVLQFGFAEEIHRNKVRKAERVKADITDVSGQVRGVLQEGKSGAGLVCGRSGGGSSVLKELCGLASCVCVCRERERDREKNRRSVRQDAAHDKFKST